MIISPCISICKTDPSTGYCYGCGRSNEEKRLWKLEETTDDWKKENIIQIEKRLTGWQLESFKESYSYKIKNGMSLFKKNLIKDLNMSKVKIISIIYVIGIIIGALFFDVWGADTTPFKTLSVFAWTVIFIIALFFVDKNERK